jgi:hypothetical protein
VLEASEEAQAMNRHQHMARPGVVLHVPSPTADVDSGQRTGHRHIDHAHSDARIVRDEYPAGPRIVGQSIGIFSGRYSRPHLEGLIVDHGQRLLRGRCREDHVLLGGGDDTVHARQGSDLLDHALGGEVEDNKRAVAEVSDIEATIDRVDPLVVERDGCPGSGMSATGLRGRGSTVRGEAAKSASVSANTIAMVQCFLRYGATCERTIPAV